MSDVEKELQALRVEHEALRKHVEKLCRAISQFDYPIVRPLARDILASMSKRKRDDG